MAYLASHAQAVKLLRGMIGGTLSVIIPKIGVYVSYPRVEEVTRLGREEAKQLVQGLWELGYLDRRFATTVYRCPHDGTASLRPRIYCPGCGSEDIEKLPLIEHMVCGHVDTERNFKEGNELRCPKCGRTLNQIGVDYRRPGYAWQCPGCGEVHPAPQVKWSCNYADHIFTLNEAVPDRLYAYTLHEEKRGEVLRIFEYIQPVKELFVKHGYESESLHAVKGASGVSHLVDVYAYKTHVSPMTCITRVLTEGGIKPEEVLKHYAISLDLEATKSLVVAIPRLDPESEVYASNLNLEIIQGGDLESVIPQIDTLIGEWSQQIPVPQRRTGNLR